MIYLTNAVKGQKEEEKEAPPLSNFVRMLIGAGVLCGLLILGMVIAFLIQSLQRKKAFEATAPAMAAHFAEKKARAAQARLEEEKRKA